MDQEVINDHLAKASQRVRVLFVPAWYPPKDGSSAFGTFVREHVRSAALYDHVAVLIYKSRPQRWPTLGWERVDDQGVPTFYATYGHSPIPKTTLPFALIHRRRAIRRAIQEWGRPDVIHTQDTYAYDVIKAAQRLGIPFVISQHYTGFMRRVLDDKDVQRFRWAFARAARVLPANKFAALDYDHYGLQASITWLPNVLDTTVFCPPFKPVRRPWLLHVSGFTAQKRFPDIVRAFVRVRAKRPEAVLHVAGDGKHRAEMEALAVRELPEGSFVFHGFLSKPQLAGLMRQSCGFVFPSEFETFGCVLMEAMACGCPVLTTRVGGIPAVVREGEAIFVEVGNIDQIAAEMIQMLDGTHGINMERVSRETRERFSYEAVGRILHEEHLRAARLAEVTRRTN